MIRKLATGFAIAAASVWSLTGPASAGIITISDLTDGPPVVTTSSDIEIVSSGFADEAYFLDGIFHIPFGNGTLAPDLHILVGLLEPDGQGLSDAISVRTDGFGGPVGQDWQQRFFLQFASDPFATIPQLTSVLIEDGTMQLIPIDQFTLRGGTEFRVFVQSDVADVPEPAALALIGVAFLSLLGLGVIRRRIDA
jgi:hypothetical protein